MAVELKGNQFGAFVEALAFTFTDYPKLKLMTRIELGEPLERIHPPAPLDEVALALVEWAQANGRLDELLAGALRKAPKSPRLVALSSELSLTSTGLPSQGLESLVLPNVPMPDVVGWRKQMETLERSVCRIEMPRDIAAGTGFLITRELLLTNYHVADLMRTRAAAPENCAARFGFSRPSDGGSMGPAEGIGFASDWLASSSPVEELDYAVIRLNQPVDRQPVSRPEPCHFENGDVHLILHHPEGSPLKLSAGILTGCSQDRTRIQYRVNTEPGSSGSPIFTLGWLPVGLHQRGLTSYNEGIPLSLIAQHGATRGLWK